MDPNKIKDSIQAVIEALTPLAQKLQVPLEKLFEWAVRENYVKAVGDGIWVIIGIALIYFGYRLLKWRMSLKGKEDVGDESMLYILAGLLLLVGTIIVGFFFYDIAARLINPEYHAILDVIDKIKGD